MFYLTTGGRARAAASWARRAGDTRAQAQVAPRRSPRLAPFLRPHLQLKRPSRSTPPASSIPSAITAVDVLFIFHLDALWALQITFLFDDLMKRRSIDCCSILTQKVARLLTSLRFSSTRVDSAFSRLRLECPFGQLLLLLASFCCRRGEALPLFLAHARLLTSLACSARAKVFKSLPLPNKLNQREKLNLL